MGYVTIEQEMYSKMTVEQLLKDLSLSTFKIADNDGRLTAESSADLDYHLDLKSDIEKELLSRLTDAKRWRALMSCERIRILGSANLGKERQHIGLELWERYPGDQKHPGVETSLTRFVDTIIKNKG